MSIVGVGQSLRRGVRLSSLETAARVASGLFYAEQTVVPSVTLMDNVSIRAPRMSTCVTPRSGCLAVSRMSRSWVSSNRVLCGDLQVSVPTLGESITDGSIAAIMKQPGDAVEEDEELLSIETDKVVFQVRSPAAGVVKSILVSPDESVEVGKLVAIVTEGEARGKVESDGPVEETRETSSKTTSSVAAEDVVAAEKNIEGVFSSESASDTAVLSSHGHDGRAHSPSIAFPKRRTLDGRVISELLEEEQKRIRAEELSAIHSARFLTDRMNAGVVVRPPLPPRRELTEREMELIMLGGAE
jgi:hypothetical protein